jgi:uncharacterized protein (TIGR03067 family)
MVRTIISCMMATVFGLTAHCQDKPNGQNDLLLMQGKWKIVLWRGIGTKAGPTGNGADLYLEVINNRMSFYEGKSRVESGKFRLNPTKTPKEIDMFDPQRESHPPLLGIYEVTDQVLILYWSTRDGEDRPRDFSLDEMPNRKRVFLLAERIRAK